MRNLHLWNVTSRKCLVNPSEKFRICFGRDVERANYMYVCCEHNLCVKSFDDENGDQMWEKPLTEGECNLGKVVDFTYLSVTNQLSVGLNNGQLYTLASDGDNLQSPGHFDDGLAAMAWSPDQEQVVVVSDTMVATLLSCTFDVICETNLLDEDFGEKQFVTVNWGKKETQFHGREGKKAREASEVIADPEADDSVKITWRGDGELYAVGFKVNGLRRFKVFDKEGHLQYTSEKQQGLESNLSWRPSGEIIATTQKLPEKYTVSFFEKNGLKHGSFDIPVNSDTIVEDILWSADSEVLTLKCKDHKDKTVKLLLFTSSNYHWYLKQSLTFTADQEISDIQWDNDFDLAHIKKLHVFFGDGELYSYSWIWSVDHSRGQNENDDAVVAVIDGRKILLTNFRQNVVPPPMAALVLEHDSFVNFVNFASKRHAHVNALFIITTDHKLIFYEQKNRFPLQYEISNIVELDREMIPLQCYKWLWLDHNIVVCVSVSYNNYSLIEYRIEGKKLVEQNTYDLSYCGHPVTLEYNPHKPSTMYILFHDGSIVEYTLGETILPQISFGVPCSKFDAVSVEGNIHFIGLSQRGRLYIDDTVVMISVSSYFVHTHFLLFTTLQHYVYCVELSSVNLKAMKQYGLGAECPNIYKRKIERGAKLVIVVPNGTRTVLQMPRGNLEVIQPRPLSLKIIAKHLDEHNYNEAFDLMRKERINLNLLFDHDPDRFDEKKFLESIKNNSWQSLFLSDLEDVDVTRTMYASSYAGRQDKPGNSINGKVRKVCELIRSNLSCSDDLASRILPLLTSYVKTNCIEDLEKALMVIKELKDKEKGGSKLPVGSEEAIKYLLYMVDVNKLFDVALGMYDFDLVLFVANKSQKDPKEYIPMLNELNEMEEYYKKFSINKHLKRYDKAVQSLVQCGPDRHAELRAFVKYHSLYRECLNLFKPQEDIYKQISDDFGAYLRLKKHFTEAGIVFERGSNVEKAVECYKDALEWELAINLALSWPKDQFQQLCSDLVSALKDEKRHKEALHILATYCENKEEAIRYSIESLQYKSAIQLCNQYNKSELKETALLPAILEECNNLQELIESNFILFGRHRDRLRFVREFKSKNPTDFHDTFANNDCDLYSDAGSTIASSSRGSTRSYRSSKNRRKHERKVASLKEGSRYEDVALVMALHTLVTSSFELRTPVKDVNIALNYFGKHKEAFVLQTSLEKLLKEMKDSFREIWSNQLSLDAVNAAIAAENVPEGGPAVIPEGIASLESHIRIAPVIQEINWKLEGLY